MATICVALGYDLLPGIQPGTWAQRTEHLASGATVLSRGARWRGDFVLDNTRLDPHFHHRKFHKLLALAGFAAVAFRGLSCHTMFGVASRRDKLAYVRFEEPVVAYGPPGLAGMTDVLCSGLTFSLCVEIDIPVQHLTRYELPAVRHLNAGVQARYTAKNTPDNPGVLYNGVYVTALSFVPMAAAGKTCAHIACRRPDDHAAIFFLFRQYLGAQLRGGIPRMRSRGEWAPKEKPVPAPTVDLDVHYGSWLLLDARDAVLQRGGVVHVLADNLRVQDFRHPLLFSMYSKE